MPSRTSRLYRLAFGTLATLALVAASRGAWAGDAPRLEIASIGQARAGETIEIRWTDVPPGVDEMELLLSVDDGRHFSLRVSPELDPRARCYRWRVPRLASAEARLRMRYSVAGRETESEPSEPFRISQPEGVGPELQLVHEAGWWHGLDAPAVPARTLGASGDQLFSGGAWHGAATDSRGPIVARPGDVGAAPCTLALRREAPARRETGSAPRVFPQRN